jgi:hypothetical protein
MTGLYPIIRRKRVPLAIAEGQLPTVDLKAAGGGQRPEAGCQMPDTGATPAKMPAPLEVADGKERRAKRQD